MFLKALRSNYFLAAKVQTLCGFFASEYSSSTFKTHLIATYALTTRPDQASVNSFTGAL
jgi:hypothetical protein